MTIKASKSRLFRMKTTLCEAFYISTSLPSIPVRNVANLQTFFLGFLVFLETIYMYFKRPLSRDTRSLDHCTLFNFYFCTFQTDFCIIVTLLHILPHTSFVYIYSSTPNIFSSLMMPSIGESFDFYLFFKTDSSLRPHLNILIFIASVFSETITFEFDKL